MKIPYGVILALLVVLTACDGQPTSSVGAKESEEPLQGAKESTFRQKHQFSELMAKKIEELSTKIIRLKSKATAMRGEAKSNLEEGVSALEAKAQDLRKRLFELKTATAKPWETMREDIESRLKNFEDTYAQIASQFSA